MVTTDLYGATEVPIGSTLFRSLRSPTPVNSFKRPRYSVTFTLSVEAASSRSTGCPVCSACSSSSPTPKPRSYVREPHRRPPSAAFMGPVSAVISETATQQCACLADESTTRTLTEIRVSNKAGPRGLLQRPEPHQHHAAFQVEHLMRVSETPESGMGPPQPGAGALQAALGPPVAPDRSRRQAAMAAWPGAPHPCEGLIPALSGNASPDPPESQASPADRGPSSTQPAARQPGSATNKGRGLHRQQQPGQRRKPREPSARIQASPTPAAAHPVTVSEAVSSEHIAEFLIGQAPPGAAPLPVASHAAPCPLPVLMRGPSPAGPSPLGSTSSPRPRRTALGTAVALTSMASSRTLQPDQQHHHPQQQQQASLQLYSRRTPDPLQLPQQRQQHHHQQQLKRAPAAVHLPSAAVLQRRRGSGGGYVDLLTQRAVTRERRQAWMAWVQSSVDSSDSDDDSGYPGGADGAAVEGYAAGALVHKPQALGLAAADGAAATTVRGGNLGPITIRLSSASSWASGRSGFAVPLGPSEVAADRRRVLRCGRGSGAATGHPKHASSGGLHGEASGSSMDSMCSSSGVSGSSNHVISNSSRSASWLLSSAAGPLGGYLDAAPAARGAGAGAGGAEATAETNAVVAVAAPTHTHATRYSTLPSDAAASATLHAVTPAAMAPPAVASSQVAPPSVPPAAAGAGSRQAPQAPPVSVQGSPQRPLSSWAMTLALREAASMVELQRLVDLHGPSFGSEQLTAAFKTLLALAEGADADADMVQPQRRLGLPIGASADSPESGCDATAQAAGSRGVGSTDTPSAQRCSGGTAGRVVVADAAAAAAGAEPAPASSSTSWPQALAAQLWDLADPLLQAGSLGSTSLAVLLVYSRRLGLRPPPQRVLPVLTALLRGVRLLQPELLVCVLETLAAPDMWHFAPASGTVGRLLLLRAHGGLLDRLAAGVRGAAAAATAGTASGGPAAAPYGGVSLRQMCRALNAVATLAPAGAGAFLELEVHRAKRTAEWVVGQTAASVVAISQGQPDGGGAATSSVAGAAASTSSMREGLDGGRRGGVNDGSGDRMPTPTAVGRKLDAMFASTVMSCIRAQLAAGCIGPADAAELLYAIARFRTWPGVARLRAVAAAAAATSGEQQTAEPPAAAGPILSSHPRRPPSSVSRCGPVAATRTPGSLAALTSPLSLTRSRSAGRQGWSAPPAGPPVGATAVSRHGSAGSGWAQPRDAAAGPSTAGSLDLPPARFLDQAVADMEASQKMSGRGVETTAAAGAAAAAAAKRLTPAVGLGAAGPGISAAGAQAASGREPDGLQDASRALRALGLPASPSTTAMAAWVAAGTPTPGGGRADHSPDAGSSKAAADLETMLALIALLPQPSALLANATSQSAPAAAPAMALVAAARPTFPHATSVSRPQPTSLSPYAVTPSAPSYFPSDQLQHRASAAGHPQAPSEEPLLPPQRLPDPGDAVVPVALMARPLQPWDAGSPRRSHGSPATGLGPGSASWLPCPPTQSALALGNNESIAPSANATIAADGSIRTRRSSAQAAVATATPPAPATSDPSTQGLTTSAGATTSTTGSPAAAALQTARATGPPAPPAPLPPTVTESDVRLQCRTFWSLVRLGVRPSDPWVQSFLTAICPHLSSLEHGLLVRVWWALCAVLPRGAAELMDPRVGALTDAMRRAVHRMAPDEVCMVLGGFGKLRYCPSPSWMAPALRRIRATLEAYHATSCTALVIAFGRMRYTPPSCQALLRQCVSQVPFMDGLTLVNLLWGLSHTAMHRALGQAGKEALQRASMALMPGLQAAELPPPTPQTATVATMAEAEPPTRRRRPRTPSAFSPEQMALLLLYMAKCAVRPGPEWRRAYWSASAPLLGQLQPRSLAAAVNGVWRLQVVPPVWWSRAFFAACTDAMPRFTVTCLLQFANALLCCPLRPPGRWVVAFRNRVEMLASSLTATQLKLCLRVIRAVSLRPRWSAPPGWVISLPDGGGVLPYSVQSGGRQRWRAVLEGPKVFRWWRRRFGRDSGGGGGGDVQGVWKGGVFVHRAQRQDGVESGRVEVGASLYGSDRRGAGGGAASGGQRSVRGGAAASRGGAPAASSVTSGRGGRRHQQQRHGDVASPPGQRQSGCPRPRNEKWRAAQAQGQSGPGQAARSDRRQTPRAEGPDARPGLLEPHRRDSGGLRLAPGYRGSYVPRPGPRPVNNKPAGRSDMRGYGRSGSSNMARPGSCQASSAGSAERDRAGGYGPGASMTRESAATDQLSMRSRNGDAPQSGARRSSAPASGPSGQEWGAEAQLAGAGGRGPMADGADGGSSSGNTSRTGASSDAELPGGAATRQGRRTKRPPPELRSR